MTLAPPPGGYHGPVKRSITIAGHQTSISLEPIFWTALEQAAVARSLPLSALVRWAFRRLGLYRLVWHPTLFDLALFVILLGGVVAVMSRWTAP